MREREYSFFIKLGEGQNLHLLVNESGKVYLLPVDQPQRDEEVIIATSACGLYLLRNKLCELTGDLDLGESLFARFIYQATRLAALQLRSERAIQSLLAPLIG